MSQSSKSTICPCQTLLQSSPQTTSSSTGYCSSCIHTLLATKIAKHHAALAKRNAKRQECAAELNRLRSHGPQHSQQEGELQQYQASPRQRIETYQDQIRTLSSNIDELRAECGRKSVSLASFSLVQSNRAAELDAKRRMVLQLRSHLDLLRSSVLIGDNDGGDPGDENLIESERVDGNDDGDTVTDEPKHLLRTDGNLSSTIQRYVGQVKRRRFQLVLETFEMHRMDVGHEHKSLSMKDLLVGIDGDSNLNERERKSNNEQKKLQPQEARFLKLVQQRIPSGIGKIGGLPLPHRGPSVYNKLLPMNVLTSSIRLIASLTNLLARCLSIELPHPIVLCPMTNSNIGSTSGRGRYSIRDEQLWVRDQTSDIVESIGETTRKEEEEGLTLMKDLERLGNENENEEDQEDDYDCETISQDDIVADEGRNNFISAMNGKDHGHKSTLGMSAMSTTSLRSFVGSSSNLLSRAFDKMKGHHHTQNAHDLNEKAASPALPSVPMDQDSVSIRLKYATHAIIYESNSRKNGNVAKYELKPPSSNIDLDKQRQEEEHFTIGLQLLQNDIIALSIQAGVPVQMLWPAEAMLLNLNSLKLYASDMLKQDCM